MYVIHQLCVPFSLTILLIKLFIVDIIIMFGDMAVFFAAGNPVMCDPAPLSTIKSLDERLAVQFGVTGSTSASASEIPKTFLIIVYADCVKCVFFVREKS